MSSTWYQICCEVDPHNLELLSDFLVGLSGNGICTENRQVDSFSTSEIPELATHLVTAWFAMPCQIEQIMAEISGFMATLPTAPPLPPPNLSILGEEDWANSWKGHFRPLKIGRRLLVTPSWGDQQDDDGRITILLDPGMAFGTGSHETTRLCLEALERIITEEPSTTEGRLLDLGTGSGLLAIAAAKLGCREIDAVDIDRQAVDVAAENCRLNAVSELINCREGGIQDLTGGYRVILANILAEVLAGMANELTALLEPEADLILSGILLEREQLVRAAFDPLGLKLLDNSTAGEWSCLHYRRPA